MHVDALQLSIIHYAIDILYHIHIDIQIIINYNFRHDFRPLPDIGGGW